MTLAELQALFWRALEGEPADRGFIAGPDRIQVYADLSVARQVAALRAQFPCCAERLGPDPFAALARRYLAAHPSDHPDLARLGRHFAEFSGEPGAALEWARCEVFHAAEVPRMEPQDFAREMSLRMIPALRLVGTTAVWRAKEGLEVREVDLPEDERRALQLALGGAPFERIRGAFGEGRRAFEVLQGWLAEGWIAA